MQTIITALTYNGSLPDTVLNGVVLVMVLAGLSLQDRSPWWIALAVMTALQVVLWFSLGVVGISVIWSGLAGAVLVSLIIQRRERGRRWALAAALVVAAVAIVYYAITLPVISTIAHLLAALAGTVIHSLVRRRRLRRL